MTRMCLYCRYFNDTDTSLPICLLLHKYTHPEWSCSLFKE